MNIVHKTACEVERAVCSEILPKMQKSARYIGHELNAISRAHEDVGLSLLLAFPDVYEVGMSYVGFKILYSVVNSRPNWLAERAFSPWPDMEEEMRKCGVPLYGLESFTPAHNFDVVGFTLQYEMSYTNVLNMLNLSGIPVLAAERTEEDPIVIAGGPCASNPEPLTSFIDAFSLGDGEEVLLEILQKTEDGKKSGMNRDEIIRSLVDIPGVYVPSLYNVEHVTSRKDGLPLSKVVPQNPDIPRRIRRRAVRDLSNTHFPDKIVVPYMELIHDRVALEAMRGCSRGCRFCQAGMIYRPVREREANVLCDLANSLVGSTGYEELSILSLSSADYSDIGTLLRTLADKYKNQGVSVSLPSLRADSFSIALANEVQKLRRTGLTFAPEAGTQRLRDVINKGVTEEDLFKAVKDAFSSGWSSIKLYFMLGLPYETYEDLTGIAQLSKKVLNVGIESAPQGKKGRVSVSVSVSSFVPKAHTPFQWVGQNSIEEMKSKQAHLMEAMRIKNVSFSWHDAKTSQLEAAFARGDRRLNDVILKAYNLGCKFDGWSEYFDYQLWNEAFMSCGFKIEQFAERSYDISDPLPWDHIDMGVTKEFLARELDKAASGELTADCRSNECSLCGACEEGISVVIASTGDFIPSYKEDVGQDIFTKIRFRVAKKDYAKFISHLDYMRSIERAARRAGLKIAFSEGFHPHAKMSFSPALSVGSVSMHEYIDITFVGEVTPKESADALNVNLPSGIEILAACEVLGKDNVAAQIEYASYSVELDVDIPKLKFVINEFMRKESVMAERKTKSGIKESDIRPMVLAMGTLDDKVLNFTCACGSKANLRPEDFIKCLGGILGPYDESFNVSEFNRTGLFFVKDEKLISPMEVGCGDIYIAKGD